MDHMIAKVQHCPEKKSQSTALINCQSSPTDQRTTYSTKQITQSRDSSIQTSIQAIHATIRLVPIVPHTLSIFQTISIQSNSFLAYAVSKLIQLLWHSHKYLPHMIYLSGSSRPHHPFPISNRRSEGGGRPQVSKVLRAKYHGLTIDKSRCLSADRQDKGMCSWPCRQLAIPIVSGLPGGVQ